MTNETSVRALETFGLHPNASQLFGVDFTGYLATGEELIGTPTITIDPSAGVTLSEKSVNDEATTNGQGEAVAAYNSILVRVAGLSAPQNYIVTAECETTFGNHLVLQCPLIGQE